MAKKAPETKPADEQQQQPPADDQQPPAQSDDQAPADDQSTTPLTANDQTDDQGDDQTELPPSDPDEVNPEPEPAAPVEHAIDCLACGTRSTHLVTDPSKIIRCPSCYHALTIRN